MRGWVLWAIVGLILSGCSSTSNGGNESFIDYTKPRVSNTLQTLPENVSDYPSQTQLSTPYIIGAWNIQIFGKTKAENENLMPIIINIIDDYDIIGIQEIRDNSYTVNEKLQDIPSSTAVFSPRLGRTDSKEQYAFIYSDRVQLLRTMTYPDNTDKFEREPFLGHFKVGNYTFIIILVHIKPDDAKNEIKELKNVIEYTEKQFKEKDIWVIGDLNADCLYYTFGEDLTEYTWLIDDDDDTTIGRSDCAYDRIIITEMFDNIYEYGIDNLTEETGGNKELMDAISDHYPVYAKIRF